MLHPEIHQHLVLHGYDLEKHFDKCCKAVRRYSRYAQEGKNEDFVFDVTSFIAWTSVCDKIDVSYNLITQPTPINFLDKKALKKFGKIAQKFLKANNGILRTDASNANFLKRVSGDKFAGLKHGITGRNVPDITQHFYEDEYWSTFDSPRFFIEEIDLDSEFRWVAVVNSELQSEGTEFEEFVTDICKSLRERAIIPHHPHYLEINAGMELNFALQIQKSKDGKLSLFDARMIQNNPKLHQTITQIEKGTY